jgi:hypothetical protein
MPIKNIVKNTWKLVKVMKNDELNLANEPETKPITETPEAVSGSNREQPQWFNNVSNSIKLFHEMFSAIRTGILPILLFCFLFIPSFVSSGICTITTGINTVLDRMAKNGQSFKYANGAFSVETREIVLNPANKIEVEALLSKKGEPPIADKCGSLELTSSQLKIVGDAIDTEQITLDEKTDTKIIQALSSITRATATASNLSIEGWVYLGKTKADNTWDKAETISDKTAIQDLKTNKTITFTDGVYLRTETKDCPRSKGNIITAIPAGETVTLLTDASKSLCEIGNTKTFAVWAKVKQN